MKKLSSALKKMTLTKNRECLTKEGKKKFDSFIHCLDDSQIIYRYIGDALLNKEFNADTTNIGVLSKHLFLYGDKGQLFYEGKLTDANLDNVESKVFENIFYKLFKIFVNTHLFTSEYTRNAIYKLTCFSEVQDYLKNISLQQWIENIKGLTNEDRIIVKNYYISFLHTVGKSVSGNESYFLSTSTDYNFCKKWREDNLENNKNGIILVGWGGEQNFEQTWSKKNHEIIRNNGLPILDEPIFCNQKEITLLCGLLPHYIIGYFYEQKFEVNPYVFEIEDMKKVQQEGLPVNQEDFLKNLNQTNLKSFYLMMGDLYVQV